MPPLTTIPEATRLLLYLLFRLLGWTWSTAFDSSFRIPHSAFGISPPFPGFWSEDDLAQPASAGSSLPTASAGRFFQYLFNLSALERGFSPRLEPRAFQCLAALPSIKYAFHNYSPRPASALFADIENVTDASFLATAPPLAHLRIVHAALFLTAAPASNFKSHISNLTSTGSADVPSALPSAHQSAPPSPDSNLNAEISNLKSLSPFTLHYSPLLFDHG